MRVEHHPQKRDHGQNQSFTPGNGDEPRPRGDEVRATAPCVGEQRRDRARRVLGIGIGEEEEFPARLLRELMAGPAFPRPSFGKRLHRG